MLGSFEASLRIWSLNLAHVVVQLHVKVGDIFEEIANFNSSQLVPIAIGTHKS